MANYWIGGSGNWNDDTHWSSTSGGSNDIGAPGQSDQVIFDSGSSGGSFTCTIDATSQCASLYVDALSSGIINFSGTARLEIYGGASYGSLELAGGSSKITMSDFTGDIRFANTYYNYLNTHGVTLYSKIDCTGSGGAFTLQSNLTTTKAITVSLNTNFSVGNYSVNCLYFSASSGGTQTLTFGSGTWTISRDTSTVFSIPSGSTVNNLSSTTIVLNANTASARTINGGGKTFGAINVTNGSGDINFNDVICDSVDFTGSTGKFTLNNTLTTSGIKLATDYTRAGNLYITAGTFDANNKNVTINYLNSNNSNERTINMGSGTWEVAVTGSTCWDMTTTTYLTINPSTSVIKLTGTLSSNDITFNGGGMTFNNFWNATSGAYGIIMRGGNTFNDFKVNAGTIQKFYAGSETTLTTWTGSGTAGNEITITSNTTSTHTITKAGGGIISLDYMNIQHSIATPDNTWYAGDSSTNNQTVDVPGSGWIFSSAPSVSPSVSASRSISPSTSYSPSSSESRSVSPSESLSPSSSESASVSPSISESLSLSPSVSLSPSTSISPSYSASPSSSVSRSISPSESISPSLSLSPSSSVSPSASASFSLSPSASDSGSTSVSPSSSESRSISPSVSISPSLSLSPSISESRSISPSISESQSISPSVSLSPSASLSPSVSESQSVSPSLSLSPSVSKSRSVSPSSSRSPSSSASPSAAPYNLITKGNTTFSVGDILRIKDGIDDEWMQVINVIDASHYTVLRDRGTGVASDGSAYEPGANPAWKKGATIVNYKQAGDGGVYMTASESNAPYISIFDHNGAPWTTINTRLRLGNLNGYLGYSEDLYGIAIGEATKYLKYDPTNGLRIAGNISASTIDIGTNAWHVDTSGNMWWGNSTTYAGASGSPRISAVGAVEFTTGSFTGTITGSTITGGTVRTSTGTTRVELNSNDNALYVYENGIQRISLISGAIGFYDSSGLQGGGLQAINDQTLRISSSDSIGSGLYVSYGDFIPETNGQQDLGGIGYRFKDGYFSGNIYASNLSGTNTGDSSGHSGLAALTGATFSGNIYAANLSGTNTGDSAGHSSLMPLSGGTFSGTVTIGSGSQIALSFAYGSYINNPRAIYLGQETSAPGATPGGFYYNTLTDDFYVCTSGGWKIVTHS